MVSRRVRVVSLWMWMVATGIGCGWTRKDSIDVVDPQLRSTGRSWEQEGRGRDYRLGPYRVEELSSKRVEPKGHLSSESTVRAPSEAFEVVLKLTASGRPTWTARCLAERQPQGDVDYGAVATERRDAVLLNCDVHDGAEDRWTFEAKGELSKNFGGTLKSGDSSTVLGVEVLMWMQRLGTFTRHLPDPVLQVREQEQPVMSMLAGPPRMVWISGDAVARQVEVALATTAAISHLPLGLDAS